MLIQQAQGATNLEAKGGETTAGRDLSTQEFPPAPIGYDFLILSITSK